MIILKELSPVPQSFLYKYDNFWKSYLQYHNHSSINMIILKALSPVPQSFLYKHDDFWKSYLQYHNYSSINMIAFERVISSITIIPL